MSDTSEPGNADEPRLWDHPAPEDNKRFKPFIQRSGEPTPHFVPKKCSYGTWSNPPNPLPYASFGDDGVTASVNSKGDLIQFSTYLGTGTSGMFCVDQSGTPEPWLVKERMDKLLQLGRSQAPIDYGMMIPYHDSENISETDDFSIYEEEGDEDEEGVEMSFVHDRWPRYEYDCVDKDLRIMKQWMVHNKTVLQQCRIMNSSESPKTLSLRFRTGMHIRDLEFANVSNTFNEDRDGHIHKPGPNGYSWILCRFCEEKNQDEPEDRNSRQETRDAVAVVVTVFVDGKAVQWTDLYSSSGPSIKFVDLKDIPIEVNDDVEVVTAYKMLSLPALGNRSWEPFLISPGEANVGHLLERESSFFRAELFSLFPPELDMKLVTDEPMDSIPQGPGKTSKLLHYLMRRNLWHILSVCSIPIPSNDDTLGFALTCGDISGHRVHTSATFFAFSFLLEFMKLITKKFGPLTEADNTYVDYIREKIMTVCRGHLEWLLRAKKTSKGSFAANYWVTGSLVNIDQYPPFTLNDALTDTAFQIIKFFQFDDIEKSDSDSPRRQDILKIAQEWMAGLAKLDRRKKCVWPRSNVEGCDKYRLSDHIWIWRASKAREALTRRSKGNPRPQDESLEGLGNRLKDANEILKRFIALNDVSSKRMISTTRSPRESRFLLHGGDTALLHALDSELFAPESPFYSPWHNTLQAQSYHVDSSEAGWDNSATYALAMMLGMKGRSIGKASPLDMVIQSLGILFGTTDSHGLFFGQIDEISKKPSLFKGESDKDWYFQVGFEIPFILLTQWSNIHLALSLHEQSQKESREDPAKLHEKTELAAMPHTLGSGYLSSDTTYDRFQKDLSRNKFQSEQTNSWTMKKYMPFTYHIDQSSIVDLADEWLYNYPTFLTRDEPIDFKKEADSLREECDMGTNIGLVVAKACRDRLPNQASLTFLLNVPKKKKESQKRNKGTVNYNIYPQKADGDAELQDLLGEARSPDEAKKRFIWLKRAFPSTALVCTLSSSAEEVQALSQFFDRHSHYDNYFIDDVSMVLNTWETELHLSFYQLWPPNQPLNLPEGIPEPISIAVPREPESQIIRNSVSFRFQGDFFDRYWTCHLVEFIPFSTAERFHHSFHPGTSEKTFGEQGCLQQRKVLELHLLDRFLKILVKSTKGIFENVQNRHSEDFNYQRATSETYFTSIAHWQDDMDILQRVEKEVLEALLVIEKWETREKDRGQERPRWTRNDESKYRPFIRKLEASTHRGTRDLRLYHNSIKSLRERLATNQERIRNDLSLRGAENIRFFTYVTVVFLPLGFAASIFSMNGAPSGETLGSVVAFAAIALVLTIVALINAKSLTTVMISIRDAIDSKSQEKMTISSLAHHDISDDGGSHVETITGDQESGNATIEAPSTHTSSSRGEHLPKKGAQHHKESKHYQGDHSWHIWFWLRYMCLVFPARRVLIACNKLKNPKPAKLMTYTHIFYGVVMLPTFLIFQLAYIIVCNFADLGQVCLNSLRGVLHSQYLDKKEEIEIQKQLDRLNRSQGRYRPLCHKLNNEEDTGR